MSRPLASPAVRPPPPPRPVMAVPQLRRPVLAWSQGAALAAGPEPLTLRMLVHRVGHGCYKALNPHKRARMIAQQKGGLVSGTGLRC